MCQITGSYEMSFRILDAISKGMKVKDIPAFFPVSIDQSKRLSPYHNLLEKVEGTQIRRKFLFPTLNGEEPNFLYLKVQSS